MYFLIQYDRAAGKLVKVETFDTSSIKDASTARLALEVQLLADSVNHEIVLLEAETEDALRKTHNRYFRGVGDLARSPQ